jgi:16S rRNA U1498 N3-methylase RsmE
MLHTNAIKTTRQSEHDELPNVYDLIHMKELYHNLIKRLSVLMFNDKAEELFKNKNAE